MACKLGSLCVLFVCLFSLGSATYCTEKSDCDTWSDEYCCSDNVCRENCYSCSYDYQCGTDEVCCDGDCLSSCSYTVWTGGAVAGAIIGTIVFFGIIISIVACFCCACCPYYRYRSPGTVIVSQPGYQPFVSTTTHTSTIAAQQVQHPPPPGNYNQPPPSGYNQPPPGYNQPPPTYHSYPQSAAQYPPPPQGQQPPMQPPYFSAGAPVKH